MSRDEYLQTTNEGFIKDTIKKGWEKVKNFFRIGIKKIRDFIAIFDSDGNVFPVVSPCAVMDKFSDSNAVRVYAPKEISQVAIDAGGNGCGETADLSSDDDVYDDGPDGKAYAEWMKNGEYKDTPEYKNFLKLGSILKESNNVDDLYIIDESWTEVEKERNTYSYDEAFGNTVKAIDHIKFEEWINKFIDQRINKGGKSVARVEGSGVTRIAEPERNMLVFGAPGIGKSTIPNTVVRKYNETVAQGDPSKMISLINVNCSLLKPGDFLMPTMPKEEEITKSIKKFSKAFPEASKYMDSLSDEEQEDIATMIKNSGQFKSSDAPKSWLPSYKSVGGPLEKILDAYANGGTFDDEDGFTVKTGNGGIIIFDEFLRADEDVFGELMNFLLYRKIHDWKLGSKWVIIACSNRPCDDDNISRVWRSWNGSPAMKGRFSRIFQLIPDPEAWKKWAKQKGCDDLILDFIFEKSSKKGNEYPRWHTEVKNGSGETQQTIPINPRQWETAINAINTYIIDNDYPNILKMSDKELEDVLEGVFDTNFIAEFVAWFSDHKDVIDIDMMMDDPKSVNLPKNFNHDDAAATATIVKNVSGQIIDRFKDNRRNLTDDKFSNIITWFGMNFRGNVGVVVDFLEELRKNKILEDAVDADTDMDSDAINPLSRYVKACMALEAAYPMNEYTDAQGEKLSWEDGIIGYEKRSVYPWPKGSVEIVKGLMKEYFPWRISGDTIKFYDAVQMED